MAHRRSQTKAASFRSAAWTGYGRTPLLLLGTPRRNTTGSRMAAEEGGRQVSVEGRGRETVCVCARTSLLGAEPPDVDEVPRHQARSRALLPKSVRGSVQHLGARGTPSCV